MTIRIVNESTVRHEHRRSPKGAFEVIRKHMSLALGGIKDTGPWGGGHPFDVEVATIPAGKRNYPLHSHAAQTEYYIILSGQGKVIGTDEEFVIKAGDHFIFQPGQAHQLCADPDQALSYIVIADNHRADVTSYPRTGKRNIKPENRVILPQEADYYEGEE